MFDRCIRKVGIVCEPVIEDLLGDLRQAGVIHADETYGSSTAAPSLALDPAVVDHRDLPYRVAGCRRDPRSGRRRLPELAGQRRLCRVLVVPNLRQSRRPVQWPVLFYFSLDEAHGSGLCGSRPSEHRRAGTSILPCIGFIFNVDQSVWKR